MNKERVYSICDSCEGCHIDKCIWIRSGGSRAPEGAVITWRKYNVGNGNGVRACLYGCIEDCPEYRKEDPKTRTRWRTGAMEDLLIAVVDRWARDYKSAVLSEDLGMAAVLENEFRKGLLSYVFDADRIIKIIKQELRRGNNG